ncbi:hypothetical protein P280DRAFT_216634 [Massarina eburnea CBS 473.64]|uniref:Uncharacterized protein n=1 Tax=Massarina eburnea CBS 473.64 TaxID=1395130 RepID=A0A6A6SAK6_9PLEO|nr:hypothetical protein P280DRAFT_216634 [Massarina eburnea CBS 473.64]
MSRKFQGWANRQRHRRRDVSGPLFWQARWRCLIRHARSGATAGLGQRAQTRSQPRERLGEGRWAAEKGWGQQQGQQGQQRARQERAVTLPSSAAVEVTSRRAHSPPPVRLSRTFQVVPPPPFATSEQSVHYCCSQSTSPFRTTHPHPPPA